MLENNEYMLVAVDSAGNYSVLVSNDFQRFYLTNSTEDPLYNVTKRVVCQIDLDGEQYGGS